MFVVALIIGEARIPLKDIWDCVIAPGNPSTAGIVVREFRLPRALIAIIVGVALGSAGSALQGLSGNPLADPYLLGIASGASLGAAIAVAVPTLNGTIPVCATLGSLGALGILFTLNGRQSHTRTSRFLLSGVVVGSFLAALGQLLLAMTGSSQDRIVAWILGDLGSATMTQVAWASPIVVCTWMALWWLAPSIDAAAFGPAFAMTAGVNLRRMPIFALCLIGVLTAIAVSISGVIGFVGFVIPHVARAITGSVQRRVLVVSALTGGSLLLFADVLSRTLRPGYPIPVGVITALLGAPALAVVLRRSSDSSS